MSKKSVFVIDTLLYIYRSYYAINNFSNRNYLYSVYIFFNMIKSLYYSIFPKYIIFVFDCAKDNFRNKLYPKYKSKRKKMSFDLLRYINFILNILNDIKINIVTVFGYEADDVIGSIVFKLNSIKDKYNIYILSFDKDFIQLINDHTFLLINKNLILNIDSIKVKYGIFPCFFRDFISLSGDPSDNIPGIKGIGLKKASMLINNIGCIDDIYSNLNGIKKLHFTNTDKIIFNLKKNFNNVYLWYKLITIKLDLDFNFDINKYYISDFFFIEIFNYLKKLKYS